MNRPLFSIGIPTYNRSGLLRRSLTSALNQTYDNVEIIVSDNASTDDTEYVVREIGDGRVRYHRNESNLGMVSNFAKLVELAHGEYFSWLQDDDVLHKEFAERAARGLELTNRASLYMAFSIMSRDTDAMVASSLSGPPLTLDWAAGEPKVIDGSLIAPLSFLTHVANLPTMAFRMQALRENLRYLDPKNLLFQERTLPAAVGWRRKVVADPYCGAIWRVHPDQTSFRFNGQYEPQWRYMADVLADIVGSAPDFRQLLRRAFDECPVHALVSWLALALSWTHKNACTDAVREELYRTLTERSPAAVRLVMRHRSWARSVARDMCPPLLRRILRATLRPSHDNDK